MILWALGWPLLWLVRRLAGPVFDVTDEGLDEAIRTHPLAAGLDGA